MCPEKTDQESKESEPCYIEGGGDPGDILIWGIVSMIFI